MKLESDLYAAAVELIDSRYPAGSGGAAAVRTASGRILTSIAPEIKNDALALCMEVGAYLEAHKLNDPVTHSLCLFREENGAPFRILTPCGICQERLRYWGLDVMVAITNPDNALIFKPLGELLSHHWSEVETQLSHTSR